MIKYIVEAVSLDGEIHYNYSMEIELDNPHNPSIENIVKELNDFKKGLDIEKIEKDIGEKLKDNSIEDEFINYGTAIFYITKKDNKFKISNNN